MNERTELPKLIIWREFIPLTGGRIDLTKLGDWHRHIKTAPEESIPGLIGFEIDGMPADWEEVCYAIERVIKAFSYAKGKRYTIKLEEVE